MKIIISESQLDKIILNFLDEDYVPDYGWRSKTYYMDDLTKWSDVMFIVNQELAYHYFIDGSLSISKLVSDDLNLKFGDSWDQIFIEWFENNTGLKVYDLI